MHSPTKTYKSSNTLFKVFNKPHGLYYFHLNYQKGIAYGKEYSMHMHYPLIGYPINILGSKTYILKPSKVLHNHTRNPTPSLMYSIIKHHGSTLLEGYYSCSKLHNTFAIPLICYPTNTLGPKHFFFKLGGVMHSPTNMG
jgi:hypothetical protein